MDRFRDCIYRLLGLGTVVFLFATYPIALIPPGLGGLSYYIRLPSILILALVSAIVVLTSGFRLRRPFAVGISVYSLLIVVQLLLHHEHWPEAVVFLGYVLIPFAFALMVQRNPLTTRTAAGIATFLWLLLIIYGFLNLMLGQELIGTTGNRNWMAISLLALTPWSAYYLHICRQGRLATRSPSSLKSEREIQRCGGRACREPGSSTDVYLALERKQLGRQWFSMWEAHSGAATEIESDSCPRVAAPECASHVIATPRFSRARTIATALAILVPSAFLMNRCFSRAAWLALAMFALLYAIHWLRSRVAKIAFIAGIGMVGLLALSLHSQSFIRAFHEDIRIPTWMSTAKLIADHPWLGVGPGLYTKAHAPYRADSEYHRRKVATDITTHPHNEFLNIAANIGLPAALCWLLLLTPIVFSHHERTPVEQCAWFSAFTVVFHGMLDQPLVQPPSDLIALASLGILWSPYIRYEADVGKFRRHKAIAGGTLLLAAVFALGIVAATVKDVRIGWHQRSAAAYKAQRDYEAAFWQYDKIASQYPRDLGAWYGAGTIAVQYLLDPQRALPYLHRAEELDPNFAHLNRLLGKAYGTLNDHPRALQYFRRECELFPADITALQNYFTCLFRNRRLDQLRPVHEYLNGLYIDRLLAHQPREHWAQLASQWQSAVEAEQPSEAISAAQQLCAPFDIRFIDPIFTTIPGNHRLTPSQLFSDFNEDDFRYWQALRTRRQIRADLRSTLQLSQQPLRLDMVLPALVAMIDATNPSLPFQAPDVVWSRRQGSPTSFFALAAWLLSGTDLEPMIISSQGNIETQPYMVSREAGRWYRHDILVEGKPSIISRILENDEVKGHIGIRASADESLTVIGQIYIDPREFLLKNQILLVVVREFLPNSQFEVEAMPSFKLTAMATAVQELGLTAQPEQLFFEAALREYGDRLEADSRKSIP